MALEKEDLLTLRLKWLQDMDELMRVKDKGTRTILRGHLQTMIRNAQADQIALQDPQAAEVH